MVGIFSRFSGSITGHRRSQSTHDEREAVPPNTEIVGSASFPATAATAHGIEVAAEFKPIEHPIEPPDNDLPVRCPLPEPSILNDGRIWKERLSANPHRRADLPVMKEGNRMESENTDSKQRFVQSKRSILPSISAPEHNIIKMLEDFKEAAD